MGKTEGNQRIKQIGKLLAITGIAGPVLFLLTWQLSGVADLFMLTLPLWGLSLIAGVAMWIIGFIKDGYSQ